MINHYQAAVSAVMDRAHLADVAIYELPAMDGRQGCWIEVVYRGLDAGPDAEQMRRVVDSVGEVSCAADPNPVVSFVAEDDLFAFAAE